MVIDMYRSRALTSWFVAGSRGTAVAENNRTRPWDPAATGLRVLPQSLWKHPTGPILAACDDDSIRAGMLVTGIERALELMLKS